MELIPTADEVRALLQRTGALRHGHFVNRSGLHTNQCLQLALALRHFSESKALCVGLSRLFRAQDLVRRYLPEISIVAPATGGLPVAFGVAEALRAAQTYWAEGADGSLHFRQFLELHSGERVVLVDDMMRTGRKLQQLRQLVEQSGAEVLAIGVLAQETAAAAQDFGKIAFCRLTELAPQYWPADECPLCRQQQPLIQLSM